MSTDEGWMTTTVCAFRADDEELLSSFPASTDGTDGSRCREELAEWAARNYPGLELDVVVFHRFQAGSFELWRYRCRSIPGEAGRPELTMDVTDAAWCPSTEEGWTWAADVDKWIEVKRERLRRVLSGGRAP